MRKYFKAKYFIVRDRLYGFYFMWQPNARLAHIQYLSTYSSNGSPPIMIYTRETSCVRPFSAFCLQWPQRRAMQHLVSINADAANTNFGARHTRVKKRLRRSPTQSSRASFLTRADWLFKPALAKYADRPHRQWRNYRNLGVPSPSTAPL